ncbi:MAG: type II secretion system minor pseudopilin GspJ [Magnetococcus sp. YQC-5]
MRLLLLAFDPIIKKKGWRGLGRRFTASPERVIKPHFSMMDRRAGFTLLELMAALAVFAVMSTMAYGGLASLMATRQEGMRRMESLEALQQFFIHFGRDVEQTWPRSMKDGANAIHPALIGQDGTERFLELTRGGRGNPRGLTRSSMERVAYSLEEGKIVRWVWPILDRVRDDDPHKEIMLDGVSEIEIRFLAEDGNWRSTWPTDMRNVAGTNVTSLPRGVAIVVEKSGWGRIRRVFEVTRGP